MTSDLAIAVPFHTSKNGYLEECLASLEENRREVSLEIIGINDQADGEARSIAESYCDQVINGPGLCNWRPGAIHWPVFQAWLTTKCPFVTYLFSDDLSNPPRYKTQLEVLKRYPELAGSFAPCQLAFPNGEAKGAPLFPNVDGTSLIHFYTETLVLRRKPFEEVGGLDYPIHAAAMAEAWIWAAAQAAGRLAYVNTPGFIFREHPETLSASGTPESKRSVQASNETRWGAEETWALWRRIEPRFSDLVRKAKENDT